MQQLTNLKEIFLLCQISKKKRITNKYSNQKKKNPNDTISTGHHSPSKPDINHKFSFKIATRNEGKKNNSVSLSFLLKSIKMAGNEILRF